MGNALGKRILICMVSSEHTLEGTNTSNPREVFAKRLGEISGSAIHSASRHINRDINVQPDNVVSADGRAATLDEIS